jgi:DNA-binding MarR family transcriptional regulator
MYPMFSIATTFVSNEYIALITGEAIKKLQEAGYIKVEKSFKNNYPNTSISITKKGLEAFEAYVNNLKKYINPA